MNADCRELRKDLKNFDGAVFSKHSNHLECCDDCRSFIRDEYPELQFFLMGSKRPAVKAKLATSRILDEISLTRSHVMHDWFGNMVKIAAVLVMLVGISSYLLYVGTSVPVNENMEGEQLLTLDEKITVSSRNVQPPSAKAKKEIVYSGEADLEMTGMIFEGKMDALSLESKYPLVEKAGLESANYIIDRADDGSRIVVFQIRSCVDI